MIQFSRRPVLTTLGLCAAMLLAAPAFAETVDYTAKLDGASEVPATMTTATGAATAKFDTVSKNLSWTVTYSGLSGAATAAHFHGPAAVGANAGPIVPISGSLASPITGNATLTDAQATDLAAGKLYFNIHTDANKGGEIRGQMMKK
ncbi:MAG: CHRD domain-containing protein [Acetobacteraceae bacterium]|nr:CHRD domain-containing protein [Acetobacteraceae bacterium]